jgi:uncharacterized protein (TIGR02246 family)
MTNRDDVLQVLNNAYAAWVGNDAEAFAALYIQDATSILPGAFRTSKDDVRDAMAAAFAGPFKGSSVVDEPQTVRFPTPDTAIVVSESGVLMAGEATVPDGRWVRATWVLTKQDDRWFISAYHNCPRDVA